MNPVLLAGCPPDPVMHYLKALGVLRLLGEQLDPGVRGYWGETGFCLAGDLDRDALLRFFLEEYRPTPLLTPWNKGSGLMPGDTRVVAKTVGRIEASTAGRFADYREAIRMARVILTDLGIADKKTLGERKQAVLTACRSHFPDAVIEWLDAAFLAGDTHPRFAPILGSGANDGNLEFAGNFMLNLVEILPLAAGDPLPPCSGPWLENALFGTPGCNWKRGAAIGQFHPGGVGGPNADQGFEGTSLVNPWNYVLMIEGTLLLAGALARRTGTLFANGPAISSFPFTVATSQVGFGTSSSLGEESRGEIWLPLWDRPTKLHEVRRFFSEGRAQVGRRAAQTGLDFARAVKGLGVDRGIRSFERVIFTQRSGRSFLAMTAGRVECRLDRDVDRLRELDEWLEASRWYASRSSAAGSLIRALHRIENAMYRYCEHPEAHQLQEVLLAVAGAEQCLRHAVGSRAKKLPPPFQGVRPSWFEGLNDESAEFHLATSLAAIGHCPGSEIPPFRTWLVPVKKEGVSWRWDPDRRRLPDLRPGNLLEVLGRWLEDAVLAAARPANPRPILESARSVALRDVQRFLDKDVDDARLTDLLAALSLVNWDVESPREMADPPPDLSRAYALLAALLQPDQATWRKWQETHALSLRTLPRVVRLLRREDLDGAVRESVRILRGRGESPFLRQREALRDVERQRMAAALLFPLADREKLALRRSGMALATSDSRNPQHA